MQRQPGTRGRDRDSFTAQYWIGRVQVVIYPPTAGTALPPVPALGRALFGREIADPVWAALVGAPDDASVGVLPWQSSDYPLAARVELHHTWLDGPAFRFVYRAAGGQPVIRNDFLRLRDEAPEGVGTRILAHQVRAAQDLGVAWIELDAEGSYGGTLNGYYTWARLGFNGPISAAVRRQLPPELRDARDVLELVTRPDGAAWWRRHGRGFPGVFDLRPGSLSLLALDAYTQARGIRI
jgi:hypothetical protein